MAYEKTRGRENTRLNKDDTQLKARTLRRKGLRLALFQLFDGHCEICGIALDQDWHADHKKPFSIEPQTDPHKMSPTCRRCNLRKGSRLNWRAK